LLWPLGLIVLQGLIPSLPVLENSSVFRKVWHLVANSLPWLAIVSKGNTYSELSLSLFLLFPGGAGSSLVYGRFSALGYASDDDP
jgi:hypothetical protein